MSKNSQRVRHTTVDTLFRKDNLFDVLNDLAEEDSAKGFSEVIRTGSFVTDINVYSDNTQALLRTATKINRIGIFTNNITKKIYANDGITLVATLIANINRDAGNNSVLSIDTSIVR